MSKFEESNFYKALQDFFINADKKTFLQFLAEFYNRTEGIINKNELQDEIIKELREMFLLFNEEGIDENIVREKVNYFIENSGKIQDIITKLITNVNDIKNISSQLDNIENNKATRDELETQKARIDLLTSVQGGQTEGNAELLDIRIGVNGKTYSTSGNAVRDSLNAIYNGLGGFYCKDITNLNEYGSNSSFGTIKNKNVITTNVSEMNIVPTNTTKANRNYLVYCSKDIYNLATVDPSVGSIVDKGVTFNNIGFITPKADKNVIFISLKDLSINKDIYFYLIDVTETSITQENFKYFDEKYINSWYFKEIDNIITTKNIVKNDGKVFDFKIWQNET